MWSHSETTSRTTKHYSDLAGVQRCAYSRNSSSVSGPSAGAMRYALRCVRTRDTLPVRRLNSGERPEDARQAGAVCGYVGDSLASAVICHNRPAGLEKTTGPHGRLRSHRRQLAAHVALRGRARVLENGSRPAFALPREPPARRAAPAYACALARCHVSDARRVSTEKASTEKASARRRRRDAKHSRVDHWSVAWVAPGRVVVHVVRATALGLCVGRAQARVADRRLGGWLGAPGLDLQAGLGARVEHQRPGLGVPPARSQPAYPHVSMARGTPWQEKGWPGGLCARLTGSGSKRCSRASVCGSCPCTGTTVPRGRRGCSYHRTCRSRLCTRSCWAPMRARVRGEMRLLRPNRRDCWTHENQ
jgi:hypothetical protein